MPVITTSETFRPLVVAPEPEPVQYIPPVEAPSALNGAFTQVTYVAAPSAKVEAETPYPELLVARSAAPAQPQTYSYEQVQALIRLEREKFHAENKL